eukprot:ANDGO_06394.mRNA.1 hypothetical protein
MSRFRRRQDISPKIGQEERDVSFSSYPPKPYTSPSDYFNMQPPLQPIASPPQHGYGGGGGGGYSSGPEGGGYAPQRQSPPFGSYGAAISHPSSGSYANPYSNGNVMNGYSSSPPNVSPGNGSGGGNANGSPNFARFQFSRLDPVSQAEHVRKKKEQMELQEVLRRQVEEKESKKREEKMRREELERREEERWRISVQQQISNEHQGQGQGQGQSEFHNPSQAKYVYSAPSTSPGFGGSPPQSVLHRPSSNLNNNQNSGPNHHRNQNHLIDQFQQPMQSSRTRSDMADMTDLELERLQKGLKYQRHVANRFEASYDSDPGSGNQQYPEPPPPASKSFPPPPLPQPHQQYPQPQSHQPQHQPQHQQQYTNPPTAVNPSPPSMFNAMQPQPAVLPTPSRNDELDRFRSEYMILLANQQKTFEMKLAEERRRLESVIEQKDDESKKLLSEMRRKEIERDSLQSHMVEYLAKQKTSPPQPRRPARYYDEDDEEEYIDDYEYQAPRRSVTHKPHKSASHPPTTVQHIRERNEDRIVALRRVGERVDRGEAVDAVLREYANGGTSVARRDVSQRYPSSNTGNRYTAEYAPPPPYDHHSSSYFQDSEQLVSDSKWIT